MKMPGDRQELAASGLSAVWLRISGGSFVYCRPEEPLSGIAADDTPYNHPPVHKRRLSTNTWPVAKRLRTGSEGANSCLHVTVTPANIDHQ